MRIILVPCVATEWREEGRLMGRVALDPLNKDAIPQAWVDQLRAEHVEQILHGPDDLSEHTARALADRLQVPRRKLPALDEVDVGLWAGLTDEDLRARYESCHRRLQEAPLDITPPGGENLAGAARRIRQALNRRVARNGVAALAVVLRPLSFAITRHMLQSGSDDHAIWEWAQGAQEPLAVELGLAGAAKH